MGTCRKAQRRVHRLVIHGVGILLLLTSSAAGQWPNRSDQRVPRTADGKLNLAAPPPRTYDGKPDLSGIWRGAPGGGLKYVQNIAADLEPGDVLPWADAMYRERQADPRRVTNSTQCLPQGPSKIVDNGMFKIIQTPDLLLIAYEEPLMIYRQVFLDGRASPTDPQPTWLGYRPASGIATCSLSRVLASTTGHG